MGKEKEQKEIKEVDVFSKEQWTSSKKFKDKKDILNALLEDGKNYSESEVNKIVEDFLKRKVK